MNLPVFPRLSDLSRIAILCAAICLTATSAQAFSLFPDLGGLPSTALRFAARWADGFGLEDGIQVGVQPGVIDALALAPLTPSERAQFQAGIVQGFTTWENAALQFDVTLDAAVQIGPDLGYEIDVIALPGTDPIWAGLNAVGLANPSILQATRTLTNGTVAFGQVITGADIYLNLDAMRSIGMTLNLPFADSLGAFVRLILHEAGHAIGLGHPDQSVNYDTDFNPNNEMILDPANPYATLRRSFNFDTQAIMVPRPCPGAAIFCQATTATQLRFDDLAGRDALYPVLPEPGLSAFLALALVGLGAARRPIADH